MKHQWYCLPLFFSFKICQLRTIHIFRVNGPVSSTPSHPQLINLHWKPGHITVCTEFKMRYLPLVFIRHLLFRSVGLEFTEQQILLPGNAKSPLFRAICICTPSSRSWQWVWFCFEQESWVLAKEKFWSCSRLVGRTLDKIALALVMMSLDCTYHSPMLKWELFTDCSMDVHCLWRSCSL